MVQPIKIRAVSPTPSAVDQCEQMLQRQVLSGQLKAGERLPGERELAERFGVTRLTLRSALSRLTGRGLLSVRQARIRGQPMDLIRYIDPALERGRRQ